MTTQSMEKISPAGIHYAVACALLGLYGTQVCPFIDSLPFASLALPIAFVFVCLLLARAIADKWLQTRSFRTQVKDQFKADLLLFVTGGLVLSVFNFLAYDFPAGSGFKVITGMAMLGFFAACDLGLRKEHQLAIELEASGHHLEIDQSPYPLTKKFGWFAGACMGILGVVVSLVLAKDLVWLINPNNSIEATKAAQLVFFEITFILAVTLAYILQIIVKYGSNLQFFFTAQQSTLNQVAEGELTVRVPVASNDEFGMIAKHTNQTIAALQTRTREVEQMQDATILALASLAEARDNETGAHILRTQQYIKVLAEHLKTHSRFQSVLTDSMIDLIYKSAPLHDAGKVGIPDRILLKPGRLTAEEFEVMKQHPVIGAQALSSAQDTIGYHSFLSVACEIMETHHEKWDGSGYPGGLKGDDIPVSGRLMALADVYDALISERVYKPAFSHEKACDIIVEGKGSHFDPDVVDAFLAVEQKFREIASTFSKPEQDFRSAA